MDHNDRVGNFLVLVVWDDFYHLELIFVAILREFLNWWMEKIFLWIIDELYWMFGWMESKRVTMNQL